MMSYANPTRLWSCHLPPSADCTWEVREYQLQSAARSAESVRVSAPVLQQEGLAEDQMSAHAGWGCCLNKGALCTPVFEPIRAEGTDRAGPFRDSGSISASTWPVSLYLTYAAARRLSCWPISSYNSFSCSLPILRSLSSVWIPSATPARGTGSLRKTGVMQSQRDSNRAEQCKSPVEYNTHHKGAGSLACSWCETKARRAPPLGRLTRPAATSLPPSAHVHHDRHVSSARLTHPCLPLSCRGRKQARGCARTAQPGSDSRDRTKCPSSRRAGLCS